MNMLSLVYDFLFFVYRGFPGIALDTELIGKNRHKMFIWILRVEFVGIPDNSLGGYEAKLASLLFLHL